MSKHQALTELISEKVKSIATLEVSVRNYIDTTQYQSSLLEDLDNWNQICSSLDTIGDTLFSFQGYIASEYPDDIGLKYIFTYGLLQALFIQQDAMCHLSEAFALKFELSDRLKEIRLLRNASIGHPTKNKVRKSTYYNYISRMTLSKYGFTLMRSFEQGQDEFIDIDLYQIMNDQLNDIELKYKLLSEKLAEKDRMHKNQFKEKSLVELFHPLMSYDFIKVGERIYSPNGNHVAVILPILRSIQKTYAEFEAALSERRDITECIKSALDEYNYALSKLEAYLSAEVPALTETDARIYYYYIREQHKYFVQIATEIDNEYQ